MASKLNSKPLMALALKNLKLNDFTNRFAFPIACLCILHSVEAGRQSHWWRWDGRHCGIIGTFATTGLFFQQLFKLYLITQILWHNGHSTRLQCAIHHPSIGSTKSTCHGLIQKCCHTWHIHYNSQHPTIWYSQRIVPAASPTCVQHWCSQRMLFG